MGTPYVGNAATFLVSTLFGLYILVVMLRFLFQVARVDFYNEISQFIVKATNPPLRRLRAVIPGYHGLDLAAIVLMVGLQMLELWLTSRILGFSASILGLLVLAIAELLSLAINVYLFAIIIEVIISWVNPGMYNAITSILYSLNEPLLSPARRLIPPIGGLDLSPLVVLIGLELVSMLVIAPISDVGRGLM